MTGKIRIRVDEKSMFGAFFDFDIEKEKMWRIWEKTELESIDY